MKLSWYYNFDSFYRQTGCDITVNRVSNSLLINLKYNIRREKKLDSDNLWCQQKSISFAELYLCNEHRYFEIDKSILLNVNGK